VGWGFAATSDEAVIIEVVSGTWLGLTALALLQAQAADQVVVTTAPPLDAERLADALRVYLDEFGIRVQTEAAAEASDLRTRLDDARALGEAVRAVAVVRVERGAPGSVELELIDLATQKALIVSVPRPARDEDLYRALALKIQAVLRATLSEARAALDPSSSLGRLVAEGGASGSPPASASTSASTWTTPGPGRLGVDAGYTLVSFPIDGPRFEGAAFRAWWLATPGFELGLGAAALSSVTASSAGVDARAKLFPVRAGGRLRFERGRADLLVGPCAEMAWFWVQASSASIPVRSTRNVMFSLGAEAEARVGILTSTWLFARATALGVLNGERYDVAGTPLYDTSRLQLGVTLGLGIGLP
jgi:hypothetical protein